MWAMKLVRPGVFEETEAPAPDPADLAPGQALVRVRAGAICGSDLPYASGLICPHVDDRADGAAGLPGFPLHEVVGEVLACDDLGLPTGSRVVGWATGFSALADLTVTDCDSLMVVPDDWSDATALTLQPLACVLETVRSLGPLGRARVAVIGLGPFGLLFAHALRAAGAGHVTGVDRIDRREMMAAFGLDECVHSSADRWARGLGDRERPNVIIEAVGHQTQTLSDALEAVADQGRIFCFGVPDQPVYPLPMETLFRKHASLTGGIVSERRRCLEAAREYLERHPALHGHLVTHTFAMREAQRAFELAARPAPGRLKVQLVR